MGGNESCPREIIVILCIRMIEEKKRGRGRVGAVELEMKESYKDKLRELTENDSEVRAQAADRDDVTNRCF